MQLSSHQRAHWRCRVLDASRWVLRTLHATEKSYTVPHIPIAIVSGSRERHGSNDVRNDMVWDGAVVKLCWTLLFLRGYDRAPYTTEPRRLTSVHGKCRDIGTIPWYMCSATERRPGQTCYNLRGLILRHARPCWRTTRTATASEPFVR